MRIVVIISFSFAASSLINQAENMADSLRPLDVVIHMRYARNHMVQTVVRHHETAVRVGHEKHCGRG